MDSRLSASIAYYTGWLKPEMEGISKEVFTLAKYFNGTIIGISNLQPLKLGFSRRMLGFSSRWYFLARLCVFLSSKIHKINHIYDSLDNWMYLSSVSSGKTILTGVLGKGDLPLKYYHRMAYIVIDNEENRKKLIDKGLPEEKVKVIYPGINLKPFLKVPPPASIKPFRILFASSPPTIKELKSRGVYDLLEAAGRLPDVEFVFLWRPWGNSLHKIKEEIQKRGLKNVRLIPEKVQDMRKFYAECHVVVAPFRENGGKSCPTSVIEALASGRPVILGPGVGIRGLVKRNGVGVSYKDFRLDEAIERLRGNWDDFAFRSRSFAQEFFSLEKFIFNYQYLYCVLNGNSSLG